MQSDYRRFTLNRELFPRDEEFNTNRLICGHLNRLKFPPNIEGYLHSRKEGLTMRKAMARANRCFCRREDALTNVAREKMSEIENGFFDRR
jgi:hypothetical protein